METTYFRRGFGLKAAIEEQRSADYASAIVDAIRSRHNTLEVGPLTFRLAQEFGFCYGVDRAVDYAYETRRKFPDRRLVLVGEIIHNPHVNAKLEAMGIVFLRHDPGAEFDFSGIGTDDVVIIPAFGVTMKDFQRLRAIGCILVDTTCGSVLNVWKRVDSYARDGFTALIHGKHYHEETQATASQVTKHPGGKYLVVFNMDEARLVLDVIEGKAEPAGLAERFAKACSPGFDFAQDLIRIGVANQTTMLSGESLAIAAEFRKSLAIRYGEAAIDDHFRAFDTICSATQERQDAVKELLQESIDLMLVVGGYNSSNTCALTALAQSYGVRALHIEDSDCIAPAAGTIRHQPVGTKSEVSEGDWLKGATRIGITAGASTPNNKVGETIARVIEAAGQEAELVKVLSEE
ncbi:MAG: 4-hydroxy-3-methylbut-2-enyl diphosphate reductase [Gemmatimonadales bacterium]|nr:4-hydroxy-3-methylbut-2-enyl diphosphate reductase [Gemmatimonadales bacterium]